MKKGKMKKKKWTAKSIMNVLTTVAINSSGDEMALRLLKAIDIIKKEMERGL